MHRLKRIMVGGKKKSAGGEAIPEGDYEKGKKVCGIEVTIITRHNDS